MLTYVGYLIEPLGEEVLPQSARCANSHCGCPEEIVSLKDSCVTFHGLDHRQHYFPMVSRTVPQSVFGLPPQAVAPRAPEVDRRTSICTSTSASVSVVITPYKQEQVLHDMSDIYGVSDCDDFGDNMSSDAELRHSVITTDRPHRVSGQRASPLQSLPTSNNTLLMSELDPSTSDLKVE